VIAERVIEPPELLRISRRAVTVFCRANSVPIIPVHFAKTDELKENQFAVFHITKRCILIRPGAPDWLKKHTAYNRVWWVNNYIRHELTHYLQYLKGARDPDKDFDHTEADWEGQQYADWAIKTYSKEVINPMTKIHPQAIESLKRYKEDLKAGHKGGAEFWRGAAGAYFTVNPSIAMKWDSLHIQSREGIAINAGFQLKIAKKKWSELEPWIRQTLANSLVRRSKGKAHLAANPQKLCDFCFKILTPKKDPGKFVRFGNQTRIACKKCLEEGKFKPLSNPLLEALGTGVGFGAGLFASQAVLSRMGKNPDPWGKSRRKYRKKARKSTPEEKTGKLMSVLGLVALPILLLIALTRRQTVQGYDG